MKLYNFRDWNKRIIQLTDWETDEILFKRMMDQIKRGWVFIDVGAEYGYYAIKAGLNVGANGKVLAIEAHPEIYGLLKRNIELYKLSNVVSPVLKAVGITQGTAKLYETTSPGSTSIVSRSTLFNECNANKIRIWFNFIKDFRNLFKILRKRFAPPKYVVPMDNLDNIFQTYGLKRIDLIKIDVEGAELDVLKGARAILMNYMPILMVEVHFGFG
ncbi:MAG: FkbM family methyltransferase [Candidatus Aenigmatarchaeota archaeon]